MRAVKEARESRELTRELKECKIRLDTAAASAKALEVETRALLTLTFSSALQAELQQSRAVSEDLKARLTTAGPGAGLVSRPLALQCLTTLSQRRRRALVLVRARVLFLLRHRLASTSWSRSASPTSPKRRFDRWPLCLLLTLACRGGKPKRPR